MYLHFYGNGLGQTWPWSSVVRGTWGQVPSSWSEAAAAAICRGWDGTREQTPKASKPDINRNQELMGFSLRMSNKSCDNLLPYALANGPHLHFPLPLKRPCHGTGDADIRETCYRTRVWQRRRKVFHLHSVEQVELIPVMQGWLYIISVNHTD